MKGAHAQNKIARRELFPTHLSSCLVGRRARRSIQLKKNVNRATGGHNERSTQSFLHRLRSIQELTNNWGHSMALQVARVLGITQSSDQCDMASTLLGISE
ncbi:hypothetical protein H112_01868 [Trichophyton rubrum D6]|uniref:Uncharacterized protein n=2 Tax=Trichophyton TaxID=5550 RepID=A0A022WAS7_TRIRU|nr:hypothetical protein H103_01873 [Trichophyton rubrum CBS 288.86]EZF76832.1 hypothetical protein H105_01878 [Trichophyton soudanense CBS 452.61]KDB36637.1 hypothetical protein H112_01868 [Trichophyton rubrum D6]